MKKMLLATSALVLAGPAFAADLRMPMKAPMVAAAPAYSWTGCYIGAQAGYGQGQKDFTDPGGAFPFAFAPAGTTVGVETQGGLAGGQIGCNYQFAGGWVLGIEGEYAWADIRGTVNDPFFAGKNGDPQTLSATTDGLGSVTGRLGYAFDRVLFYGKGGAAWAHDRYSMSLFPLGFAPAVGFNATETRAGWTVGVGLEYAFFDNWSVKVEYNHYDFGTRSINLTNDAATIVPADIDQRIDTIKIGLNYRFWSAPAAVMARY